MKSFRKIALGGGCHWCTEAVFQSLKGVSLVEQGFVASNGVNDTFSEAVIVHYDESEISSKDLISIHLHTHESTSGHSMRNKYRSAVYVFQESEIKKVKQILKELQGDFEKTIITRAYLFRAFKFSDEMFHSYYYSNTEKPFCKRYIAPKLKLLLEKFSKHVSATLESDLMAVEVQAFV
jgi:peptide-methionine (S)-S-oxide reductase